MDTPFDTGPVGFDALYGLEVLSLSEEEVRAQVAVRDELKQPAGLVHGGVFASIAESVASMATWMAVHPQGKTAQGLSNQTSFLRPILEGTIHARRPPPSRRAHDLDLGGRHHGRPRATVRARADDGRGARRGLSASAAAIRATTASAVSAICRHVIRITRQPAACSA